MRPPFLFKRLTRLLIVLTSASVALPAPASAAPTRQDKEPTPTPSPLVLLPGQDVADVPADIDTFVDASLPGMARWQSDYYATFGQYAQVLWMYAIAPADGKAELPTLLDVSPTDQTWTRPRAMWEYIGLQAFPANWRVDVYDGPAGKGYVVTFETEFDKVRWQRSINIGAETWRDASWHEVIEP